jgi:hypothetical protein
VQFASLKNPVSQAATWILSTSTWLEK